MHALRDKQALWSKGQPVCLSNISLVLFLLPLEERVTEVVREGASWLLTRQKEDGFFQSPGVESSGGRLVEDSLINEGGANRAIIMRLNLF